MARRTNKKVSKKKTRRSSKEKDTWVTIGSINESKKGNEYFQADEYYGDLVFIHRDEDGKKLGEYLIKMATIMEPFDTAPDFIKDVLRINLDGDGVEPRW